MLRDRHGRVRMLVAAQRRAHQGCASIVAVLSMTCVVVLAGAGCVSEATEALVIFDTNVPAERVTTITASVVQGSATSGELVRVFGATPDSISLPASFAVVPGPSGVLDDVVATRIRFDVAPGLHGEPSIHFDRTTRFRLVPHRTMQVRVYLPVECGDRSNGCTSVPAEDCTVSLRCDELGQTCGDRAACVAPDVPLGSIDHRDAAVGEHSAVPPASDGSVAAGDGDEHDSGDVDDAMEHPADIVPVDASPDTGMVDASRDALDISANVDGLDGPSCPGGMHDCSGVCVWSTSNQSCGSSCVPCPAHPHATATCSGVSCGDQCEPGFADCNGIEADGCEANLQLPGTCGSCATSCSASSPVCTLFEGIPVCAPSCIGGTTRCGLVCKDLQSDSTGCGSCSRSCPAVADAMPRCTAGVCGIQCNAGFHNCGGACRSDASVASCGTGCTPCRPPPNATALCDRTSCDFVCDTGWSRFGSSCTTAPAPRQVSPLSTNVVTSAAPTLSWELPSGGTGAWVSMCTNRAMSENCTSFEADGSSGRPATGLAPGVWFWRLQTLSGPIRGALSSPVWQMVVRAHSTAIDAHWGALPDVNGDGFGDLVVGASESASAFVFPGGAIGTAAVPGTTLTAAAGSGFGEVIASVGDVNGDGFADIAIGAALGVNVYLGSVSGLRTTAASTIAAAAPSVSAAGDVNGDGYADVIVGEPGVGVSVYAGSVSGLATTASVTLTSSLPSFGAFVASAGDVNGDGFGDVLAGAPGEHAGLLYLGSAAGLSTTGLTLAHVTSAGCAGDVNGDGYADLVVGAADESLVYLALGSAAGLRAPSGGLGVTGSLGLGSAVAGVGDVDGDGWDDVIVGDALSGAVWLFRGDGTSGLAGPALPVSTSLMNVGNVLAGVGDTQGDRLADFAIGAPGMGSVQVFNGSVPGGSSPGRLLTGSAGFGGAVAQ